MPPAKTHASPHVSCPHMKPLLALFLSLTVAAAADLTLLDAGKTDYQIVLPDVAPTPAIDENLQQTARLLQTAFLANKAEIAVVREKERDASEHSLRPKEQCGGDEAAGLELCAAGGGAGCDPRGA